MTFIGYEADEDAIPCHGDHVPEVLCQSCLAKAAKEAKAHRRARLNQQLGDPDDQREDILDREKGRGK
jgi:hypothetical protein